MDPLHVLALVVGLSALLVVGLGVTLVVVAARFFRTHAVTVLANDTPDRGALIAKAAVKARTGDARAAYRKSLARDAWAYACRITQKEAERMDHALGYARKVQQLDDGEAEFKDHEMRLAIELAATQGAAPASQG